MKELQVTRPRTFEVVQVPVPDLEAAGSEKILVQPEWFSLCGSDIPFFTGRKRFKNYPLPAGAPIHECVGKVVKSTSSQYHPGDRVVAIPEGDQGLAELFVAQAAKAGKLPDGLNDELVSISPITSATLRECGYPPQVEAESATMEGMIQGILRDAV